MKQRSTDTNNMNEYRLTPAKSTIRYAKIRAMQDPDYVARKHSGVYYGLNVFRAIRFKYNSHTVIAHTRGAVVK